jgi:hypothetical protein
MAEVELQAAPPVAPRIRFSLGSLLLLIAVIGLALALFVTNRQMSQIREQLAQTESELATLRPLPVEEVARQFESNATLGPIKTTVRDVRYSPKEDAYRVTFSWVDSQAKQEWSTDLELRSDGFGQYYGVIMNGPFIEPLGNTHGFTVLVKAPSALKK